MSNARVILLLSGLLLTAQVCRSQTLISISADNVNVAYREPAELSCTVQYSGSGQPNITITKEVGSHSSPFSTATVDGTLTLTLLEPAYSDIGSYECTASNTSDSLSTTFFLIVQNTVVFLTEPVGVTVDPGTTVQFNCTPNQMNELTWLRNGQSVTYDERILQSNNDIVINTVEYSDIGTYTCLVELDGGEYMTSAALDVNGYEAPSVFGVYGESAVYSEDQTVIECPIVGTPGPDVFYWEYEDGTRVPNRGDASDSEPFVNSAGILDISRAGSRYTGRYVCIGVDVAGANATKRFYVEIEEEDSNDFYREWYFILSMSILGFLLLAGTVLLVWFIVINRDVFVQKVTKKVRVRQRVRRPTAQQRQQRLAALNKAAV